MGRAEDQCQTSRVPSPAPALRPNDLCIYLESHAARSTVKTHMKTPPLVGASRISASPAPLPPPHPTVSKTSPLVQRWSTFRNRLPTSCSAQTAVRLSWPQVRPCDVLTERPLLAVFFRDSHRAQLWYVRSQLFRMDGSAGLTALHRHSEPLYLLPS